MIAGDWKEGQIMGRNLLKTLVRPEGFEPPAYRSVVCSNTESQATAGNRGSVFLALGRLSSLPYPVTLAHSGSTVVAENHNILPF